MTYINRQTNYQLQGLICAVPYFLQGIWTTVRPLLICCNGKDILIYFFIKAIVPQQYSQLLFVSFINVLFQQFARYSMQGQSKNDLIHFFKLPVQKYFFFEILLCSYINLSFEIQYFHWFFNTDFQSDYVIVKEKYSIDVSLELSKITLSKILFI